MGEKLQRNQEETNKTQRKQQKNLQSDSAALYPCIRGKNKGNVNLQKTDTSQDGIKLAKIIHSVFHIQDYYNQYVMEAVDTYKQVNLLYQAPYQSNEDYLKAFKDNLKLRNTHNIAAGYHTCLSAAALLKIIMLPGMWQLRTRR